MVEFFLRRPVFAWVLAIVTMLAGAISIATLPVQQYPNVAPPAVEIQATYPGASAKTVADTVVKVIEQQMTGLDGLIYMSSTASSSGSAQISLTFALGTDPNIAQVQVQNKLSLAEPRLPAAVRQQGISVTRSRESFLMVAGFVSKDSGLTRLDLGDAVSSNLQEPVARVQGVGNVQVFGSEYAMRVWLDPSALSQYGLSVGDVTSAIEAQNVQLTAGELGGLPAVEGQQLNATVTAQTLFETPEQFREILLKTQEDGSRVRLEDVARVELGAGTSHIKSFYNGEPAAGMAINLAPGANALATTDRVKERLAELGGVLPAGVEVVYPYETAPFVEASMESVVETLVEAIILVVLVMLLFLQSWRATLIPTLAIPIVLLGAFAVMAAMGFSINMLTLFGLVLAIGLLVDDATVVVENVERVMEEEGLGPAAATRKAMGQITGALVGIAGVLAAVFVPMAFFPGSTGAIYRQFSLAIVAAMALSVLVALILSPIVCSRVLERTHGATLSRRLFGWFDRAIRRLTKGFVAAVGSQARHGGLYGLAFLALAVVMAALFWRLPTGFLPDADQGVAFVQVKLPTGATQQRLVDTLDQVEAYFLEQEAVDGLFTVAGFSFAGQAQNAGLAFVNLKPWSEREAEGQSISAVIESANRELGKRITDGQVFAFNLPAIPQLGNATGFQMQLQDRGGLGHGALMEAQETLLEKARESSVIANARSNGLADNPQLEVTVDREKAQALGVSLGQVNELLSVAWGSAYVNDFVRQGRVKRVFVQGDAPYRMLPHDLYPWYMKNASGGMTALGELIQLDWTYGSPRLESYNSVPSREIQGSPAPGHSSGDAMEAMERFVSELPQGIGLAWSGLSYQERQAGAQAPVLYALAVLVAFLALAALYESWTIPLSVMAVVPLGVLGGVLAAMARDMPNGVFFQVGILTTIGVTARNAILLVEFAQSLEQQGYGLLEATQEAARVRLRPILMTAISFGAGVAPLTLAGGAGAAARAAIGTAVLGGMVAATVLGTFFIPLAYMGVRRGFGALRRGGASRAESPPA